MFWSWAGYLGSGVRDTTIHFIFIDNQINEETMDFRENDEVEDNIGDCNIDIEQCWWMRDDNNNLVVKDIYSAVKQVFKQ